MTDKELKNLKDNLWHAADVLRSVSVVFNLLFLGIVASLGCFIVWNRALKEIGNVTATNFVYLIPFFTLVAAVTVLGERLSPLSALGSAAIVAGVIIAGRYKQYDIQ